MAIDPSGPVRDILDRRPETELLEQLIRDGRDILVHGPRRLGKTSLVLHVAEQVASDRLVLHVDCTRKETDDQIAEALLRQLTSFSGRWARFWDWVKSHLQATGTVLVQDGSRTRIELDLSRRRTPSIPDAIDLIAKVADKARTPVLIILDEWQVVMKRNDDALLWQMRSVSQEHRHLQLLFSGSEASILTRMLESQDQAFWKGLIQVPVKGLGIRDVLDDLPHHDILLDEDAIDLLDKACGQTTLRLIEVLHQFEGHGSVDIQRAREAIAAVVRLHKPDFEQELEKVKPGTQRRLLFGLARDRPEHPTGHEFIKAHGLKTAPSARAALTRLRDLNILDSDNEFVDALFRWYLSHDPDTDPFTRLWDNEADNVWDEAADH